MDRINKILDIVLLPKHWHERITSRIYTLVIGVLCVGAFDVFINSDIIRKSLADGGLDLLKVLIVLFLIAFLGTLDALSFAWPIGDLCRYFSKKRELDLPEGIHYIIMKVYCFSHLIFLPFTLLLLSIANAFNTGTINIWTKIGGTIAFMYILFEPYWVPGIITRTIGIKMKLNIGVKAVFFIIVMLWWYLTSIAFGYLFQYLFGIYNKLV